MIRRRAKRRDGPRLQLQHERGGREQRVAQRAGGRRAALALGEELREDLGGAPRRALLELGHLRDPQPAALRLGRRGAEREREALPDGPHFVVGLTNGKVRLYSVGSEVRLYHVDCTLVHTFKGHTNWVIAVAVTPDGQHIISGSYDNLVKVWNVATKSLVSTCAGHTHFVTAVAAMPDGQRILSGSQDKTVRVWLLNGTLENTFQLHTDNVRALVALPDNQHALSGSIDKTVKLFNVTDGTVLRTFKHHTYYVSSLALLPDGLRFVSGSLDGTARIAYHGLAA